MGEHLAAHGEMETTPELLEELGQISTSSVRRRLDWISQETNRGCPVRGLSEPIRQPGAYP